MIIRKETEKDYNEIYSLVKTAFATARVSDGEEQDFVLHLRKSGNYINDLALVAQEGDSLIGFIMLTSFPYDDKALLVAPLCVALEHRNRKIGAALMEEVLKAAKEMGFTSVFLVGDPDYYRRFGFRSTIDFQIRNEDGIPDQFCMALELQPGGLNTPGTVSFQV